MVITVHSENHSTALTDEQVEQISRSLSIQGTHHIAKAWGLGDVSVQMRNRRGSGDWSLLFLDRSDQEGALGYHDFDGTPVMKVFVKDCIDAGVQPSACASHELAEAMCDPDIIRCTVDGQHNRLWAVEIGDPCQSFTYSVAGWAMQDFVTPNWFIPGATAPYSYQRKVTAPFQVPNGGYAQYLDLANPSQGWHSIGSELGQGGLDPRPALVPRVGASHDRPRRVGL